MTDGGRDPDDPGPVMNTLGCLIGPAVALAFLVAACALGKWVLGAALDLFR